MSDKRERAIAMLQSLPLVEVVDLLEPLQAGIVNVTEADDDNLLMRMDEMIFCVARTPNDLKRMRARFEPMSLLNLHAPFDASEMMKEFHFRTLMQDYNVMYPKTERLNIALPPYLSLDWLRACDVAFVHTHYKTVDDEQYIAERIEAGMLGAYVNGQLAGFIGTHDEMTMGLLYVLPAYRRMQLGYWLEASLINHLVEQGRIPFAQVDVTNAASLGLQNKLGMIRSSQPVQWFFDRKGDHDEDD